jgi:hypothetical protein
VVVTEPAARIDLLWLPLGAGGRSVRLNGRVFETIQSRRQRREALALYHSALEVRVPEGRYAIEMTPVPRGDGFLRGVVAQGPVGLRLAGRIRIFRYEVRCWRNGVIPDADEAVASPRCLSTDPQLARHLLDVVPLVPTPVWGLDELEAGEMWTSNSVISWILGRSGLPIDIIRPPVGGRAPGWDAGRTVAKRAPRALEPAVR